MALGKSLGNILGDYFGEDSVQLAEGEKIHVQIGQDEIEHISLENVKLSPFQTRRQFDEEKINKLAQSIKKSGLIHPILVLKKSQSEDKPASYTLIAGERRLRALQHLGAQHVLAVVKKEENLSDSQHAMLTAMENLEREDLNAIELANTFIMLMQTQVLDEKALAEMLKVSLQHVKNYIRLLSLPEQVQQALIRGDIGEGHARHLVGLTEDKQLEMLDLILQKDLTAREIAEILARKPLKEENKFIQKHHNVSEDYFKRAQKLASYFPNSKLKVAGDDDKGKIIISWGDN
jgi:ParB family transcriptional regulator, chromosome partitioning protein